MQPPPPKSSTRWIVVGIVGVLVVGCTDEHRRSSRRGEAEINLDAIKKAVKAQVADRGGFVEGEVLRSPDLPCCDSERKDRKCEVRPAIWEHRIWQALDFRLDEPHYFRYSYEGALDHFVARAVGDLDCDDTEITYVLEGDFNDGNPTYTLIKPARAD
jgi:hypothetical protein